MKNLVNLIGGTYYVTLASCGSRSLIDGPEDVRPLEEYLEKAVLRQIVSVHAFCWLRRELHMGIDLNSGSLSTFVRTFAACVARDKNRRTNCFGPLFTSGYGALLIHAESLLLPLIRYLHLLPSYLGLVTDPTCYPWSSHKAFLDPSARPPWLNPRRAMSFLSPDLTQALDRYSGYTSPPLSMNECMLFSDSAKRAAIGPPEWLALINRNVHGLQPPLPPLEPFLAEYASRLGYSLAMLASKSQRRDHSRARAIIANAAISQGIASLSTVARFFNRTPSALYLAIRAHANSHELAVTQKLQNSETYLESHASRPYR